MDIVLSGNSQVPLYEQIELQIKAQILDGTLPIGTQLPAIRYLAKELNVSVITTKKAYELLNQEGLTETISGKGTFVAIEDTGQLTDVALEKVKKYFSLAISEGRAVGMKEKDLSKILAEIWEAETNGNHSK